MEQIGVVQGRQILYVSIRKDNRWFDNLPNGNWCVFTVAGNDDKQLIDEAVGHCIDKEVAFTCSAGQLGGMIELSFDLEIARRAVEQEDKTGVPFDYEQSPSTTMHQHFSEGFWFATALAYHPYQEINTVVCLDFTTGGVKQMAIELIKRINAGWLPSDEEIESPICDDQV